MRKTILLILTILLATVVGFSILSCNNETKNGYTLELVNDSDCFEFTVGEIDWSSISFFVYDEEGVLLGEPITATESMIHPDDLAKLQSPGTKTVTLSYQGAPGATLQITFKLNTPVVVKTFKVIFNAGGGTFNADGTLTEGSNIREVVSHQLDAIPTPIREGYEFIGWYEDPQGLGNKIITPYVLKRDLTLYAKWSDERKFNVSYYKYQDTQAKGLISEVRNVEYGTTIDLLEAEPILGFDFVSYKITNLDDLNSDVVVINDENELEEYTYRVVNNLSIVLQYNTRMLTFTYISDAWSDNTVVNGVNIVGGMYTVTIPYGQELYENIAPIPVLPQKEGYTGVWIDDATGQEPVYYRATTNMLVRANYTIKQYVMSFYDEFNQPIPNTDRIVDYNSYIDTEPNVPTKVGHDGYWMAMINNQLTEVALKTIKMTSDVKVYAFYTPKQYQINFHYRLEEMAETYVETFTYLYGDVITTPVDLTQDKEINNKLYKGYDGKYYEVLWFATSALQTEVKFPVDVVGNTNYYYKLVERPFIVDFIAPELFQNVGITSTRYDNVKPNSRINPPRWEDIEGYVVTGWYYDKFAPSYDASISYVIGDIVYYNSTYYEALNNSTGIVPGTDAQSWKTTTRNRVYITSGDLSNGIEINDFHEYNEDVQYNRAFYPMYDSKRVNLVFHNLVINRENDKYAYSFEEYSSSSVLYGELYKGGNVVPPAPEYPDGSEGRFVFEGWYLESEFITLPIDLTKYILKEDTELYAKWVDELIGTEGLIYTPYEIDGDEVLSYQVSGFVSNMADFSHVKLRIPEKHNGVEVVAIGSSAFDSFNKVYFFDEIVISKNIKHIGENAFTNCFAITNFEISVDNNYYMTDEYGVMYSKDGATLVSVANKNAKFTSLSSYQIPSAVNNINGGAFANAQNLEEVKFEEGTQELIIGKFAFDGCINLKEIAIPDRVIVIDDYAFRGCYNLKTIDINNTTSKLYKVGQGVFADCSDALTTRGDYLLVGNVLIKYLGDASILKLDDTIVAIADGAFNRGISDENASNYQITELEVGENSNLGYIGNKVFMSCSNLTVIKLLTNEKVIIESDSFNGIALSSKLYVNSTVLDEYKGDILYTNFFDGDSLLGA